MNNKIDLRPTEEMLGSRAVMETYDDLKDFVSVLVISRVIGYHEGRCNIHYGYSFDDLCALHEYSDYVNHKLAEYIGYDKVLIM